MSLGVGYHVNDAGGLICNGLHSIRAHARLMIARLRRDKGGTRRARREVRVGMRGDIRGQSMRGGEGWLLKLGIR